MADEETPTEPAPSMEAPVVLDSKHGFLKLNGNYAIEPKYDGAESFEHGLARVKMGDAYGYVAPTGQVVWEPSK